MPDSRLRRAASILLGRLGYREISRPQPEGFEVRGAEELFCVDPLRFAQIMRHNREVVSGVGHWLDEEIWRRSYWRYGSKHGAAYLDGVESRVTYTDAILFLAGFLKKPVKYLEVGVSAGKNFLPVCRFLKDALIVGMDIEEINPVLEKYLTEKRVLATWDEQFEDRWGRQRDKRSSLSRYACPPGSNTVLYISGNKFNAETWAPLREHRFNLIFSDACHRPESVESEMAMIRENSLIDGDEFILFWDDLGGRMTEMFSRIARQLCEEYGFGEEAVRIYELRGTYGKKGTHLVGCVAKLEEANLDTLEA
jgi:hypothetical protein